MSHKDNANSDKILETRTKKKKSQLNHWMRKLQGNYFLPHKGLKNMMTNFSFKEIT
jgi:hypothetical protein